MIVIIIVNVVIEEMATGQKSATVFNRVANYNDSGPTFNCSLEGVSAGLKVKWEKYGSNVLPFGISQLSSKLIWSRPLDFGDSGLYMCKYVNKRASILRLAVKRKSSII